MSDTRVQIAGGRNVSAGDEDPFQTYPPPFSLTSDMLLVGATCPAAPIRRTFPDRSLLTIGERAILGIWFSRILEIRAGAEGQTRIGPEEAPQDLPYSELNVAVVLRERQLFVPGIYATSDLTLRLGHRYGMPKRRAEMRYEADAEGVRTDAERNGAKSFVVARPLPGGHILGGWARQTLPWWSWPTHFPSGSHIQGHVERATGAHAAWISEGELALDEPWLPDPAPLWRLGLHVPRQIMTLPDPEANAA